MSRPRHVHPPNDWQWSKTTHKLYCRFCQLHLICYEPFPTALHAPAPAHCEHRAILCHMCNTMGRSTCAGKRKKYSCTSYVVKHTNSHTVIDIDASRSRLTLLAQTSRTSCSHAASFLHGASTTSICADACVAYRKPHCRWTLSRKSHSTLPQLDVIGARSPAYAPHLPLQFETAGSSSRECPTKTLNCPTSVSLEPDDMEQITTTVLAESKQQGRQRHC